MKRTKIILAIAISMIVASCSKPSFNDEKSPFKGDYLVLNNGNWNSNDSNIAVYDLSSKSLTEDAFFLVNEKNLGNLGQDILVCGNEIYISVSSSRRIFVTDLNLNIKKEITYPGDGNGQDSGQGNAQQAYQPRYLCEYNGKVYVTYYEGFLGRISPEDGYKVECTQVGEYPEGVACCGGKAYVANSGGGNHPEYGNTVSIVDLASFKETGTFQVNTNPEFIEASEDGSKIFVSSKGNYFDIPGTLEVVSTSDGKVTDLSLNNLVYMDKGPGNKLYLLTGGYDSSYNPLPGKILVINMSDTNTGTSEFMRDGAEFPKAYSLSATSDGYIFVGCSDYQNNGDVYVITPEGNKYDKFDSMGLNPIRVIKK